mmetsp:Transcript_22179/g.50981  ORF Transcript_22179/g.50981 Transcript_22179/m.50981 type:complete len:197 (-) Transcript_22179:547-1137(-)
MEVPWKWHGTQEEALAAHFAAAGDGASLLGLGRAFAFSALPLLTSHYASSGGAVRAELRCDDFAAEKAAQPVATAVLFANDVDGGETTFPALGLRVAPRRGRLLLYTSMTSGGACDPLTISAEAPLSGATDKLTLTKVFYSDTTFDRGSENKERPQQDPPSVRCPTSDLLDCFRQDPNGLPVTGAVVQAGYAHKRG